MKRKVSISTGTLQKIHGDIGMLEVVRKMGADAIDFSTDGSRWDYRNPQSIYSKSDEEMIAYFSEIRRRADELGLEIGQTHGRLPGFKNIPEEALPTVRDTISGFTAVIFQHETDHLDGILYIDRL